MKRIYMAGMGLSQNPVDVQAYQTNQHGYGIPGLKTTDFFQQEYQLNYKISMQNQHLVSIPQISIWDGIVMGGGVGLSIHGKYRVATQNTMFAMPECNIGFFPDVGTSFVLPRLKGGIGNYIALTGTRLKADDLMYTGLATHYVPSEKVEGMIRTIVECSNTQDEDDDEEREEIDEGTKKKRQKQDEDETDFVASVLMAHHEDSQSKMDSFLARNRDQIDEAFQGKESIEDIMSALEGSRTEFASETLAVLQKMSPTSLKVTLESMIRGEKLKDIGECLKMEYRIGQVTLRKGSDFYEGIRAALVDKDRKPKWRPACVEDVTDEMVASYFQELGENELVLPEWNGNEAGLLTS